MTSTPIRISPLRLCSWFGAFVFMVTAPLGCGGCAPMEAPANAQETAVHAQELSTAPRPTEANGEGEEREEERGEAQRDGAKDDAGTEEGNAAITNEVVSNARV